MADACIEKLMTRADIALTIASNILPDAEKLASKYPGRAKALLVNVTDEGSLGPMVDDSEVVISYIPPFLHIHVAK
jgi:saccharopine dehydrogenase-like NADP-dependent oxidoreductase